MPPDGNRDPEPVSDESIVDRIAEAQYEKHKWIDDADQRNSPELISEIPHFGVVGL